MSNYSKSKQQQQQQQQQQPSTSNNRTESWETLCPLTEIEKQSIQIIQKSLIQSTSTAKLIKSSHLNTPISTRPSSPSTKNLLSLNYNHHSTSKSDLTNTTTNHQSKSNQTQDNHEDNEDDDPIKVHQPIQTIEAFNDWYQHISTMIETDSESTYQSHLTQLKTYSTICSSLLHQISLSEAYLKEIKANWKFVDENSKSLERSSEGMLLDQKLLNQLQYELFEKLNYFRKLEDSQRLLSMNAEVEIVRSPDFLPMLEQLDLCLDFMKSNRHFRDADLYLVRFQQCLTRSMTLIKLHFIHTIRTLTHTMYEKLSTIPDQQDHPTLQVLFYKKFQTVLEDQKGLLIELETRAIKDPNEYLSILNECFVNWVSIRQSLLNSKIRKQIERIAIENDQLKDLIKLTNTGCSYLRQVCGDEYRLFKQFFPSSGDDEVFTFLESLCDYLYDLLRPQILHESNLETLCELATIVNSLIAIDTDLIDDDPSPSPDFPNAKPFKFSSLLNPILQDIQTRLIFRSQSIIQLEVAHYQPKAEDLDYPNKLIKTDPGEKSGFGRLRKGFVGEEKEDEEYEEQVALRFRLPSDDVQELWYPTLRKTLWVLSKLHTYVNDAIFEDFAGEAVGICSQSIIDASKRYITSRTSSSLSSVQPGNSNDDHMMMIDSELFIIRHLLILKKMIRTIDVSQTDRAVDLSPLTDLLKDLLFTPTDTALSLLQFKPSEFLKGLTSFGRRASSGMSIDGKSELDRKLKLAFHQLILDCCKGFGSPLEGFLGRCAEYLGRHGEGGGEGGKLREQEWATEENVKRVYETYLEGVGVGVRKVLNRIRVWLEDEKIVNVIFPSFQDELLIEYQKFYNFCRFEFHELVKNQEIKSLDEFKNELERLVYD